MARRRHAGQAHGRARRSTSPRCARRSPASSAAASWRASASTGPPGTRCRTARGRSSTRATGGSSSGRGASLPTDGCWRSSASRSPSARSGTRCARGCRGWASARRRLACGSRRATSTRRPETCSSGTGSRPTSTSSGRTTSRSVTSATQVAQWWDLDRLQALYDEFLDAFTPVLARWRRRRAPADAGRVRRLRARTHRVATVAVPRPGAARRGASGELARRTRRRRVLRPPRPAG